MLIGVTPFYNRNRNMLLMKIKNSKVIFPDKTKYKPANTAPPKPKLAPGEKSAYLKFCAAQREAHTGEKKLTLKELGAAWKMLDARAQAGYA